MDDKTYEGPLRRAHAEWKGGAALRAALDECRRTYVGPGPCYRADYLAARRVYHARLVDAGLLDPKLADKEE